MDGQMMWNQSLAMMQNQSQLVHGYERLILNQNITSTNTHNEINVQSEAVNNNQSLLQKVKQESSLPQIQIPNLVPQQDLKFSSSQDESQQENSNQQKTKKINKKPQKMPSHAAYKKYSRITPEIKQQLINLIARQNMSIKDASIKLKINYSSAKFIFSRYRDRKLQIIDHQTQKDQVLKDLVVFKKIEDLEQTETSDAFNKIVVKCSSGGKFQAQTDSMFNLKQIYELYLDPNGPLNKLQDDSD